MAERALCALPPRRGRSPVPAPPCRPPRLWALPTVTPPTLGVPRVVPTTHSNGLLPHGRDRSGTWTCIDWTSSSTPLFPGLVTPMPPRYWYVMPLPSELSTTPLPTPSFVVLLCRVFWCLFCCVFVPGLFCLLPIVVVACPVMVCAPPFSPPVQLLVVKGFPHCCSRAVF